MFKFQSGFLKSERGSFLPIFAISLVPLLLTLGLAVDYSSASTTRSSMQNALDAATLSIVTLPKTATDTDRQKALQAAFLANGGQGTVKIGTFTLAADGTVDVKATANYAMPTNFMQVAMIKDVPIAVQASVNKTPSLVEATFKIDKISGYWNKTMTLYGVPFSGTTATALMQIQYTYKEYKTSDGAAEPKGYGTSTMSVPDGKDNSGNIKYKTVQTMGCSTTTVSSLNNVPAGSYPGESSYKKNNKTYPVYFSTTCTSTMVPATGKGAVIDVSKMDNLYLEMKVTTGTTGTFKSNSATTSDRLYIGNPDVEKGKMIEVAKGKIVDIFTAVPCGKTSNQAWEDGGDNPPSPDVSNADFFYNVTGKCNFSERPSETVLTQ